MTLSLSPESEEAMESTKSIPKAKPPTLSPRESVAVVGSGMAGLVTAHLLVSDSRKRFEVEVLEMQDVLSLDSASYTLPSETKSAFSVSTSASESTSSSSTENEKKATEDSAKEQEGERIDLPMRAFAAGYYDNLRTMYEYLGVSFAEPKFVYSLSTLPGGGGGGEGSSLCKESEKEKGGSKQMGDGDGVYFIHSSNSHILPPIRPRGLGTARWMVEIGYLVFWYLWFTAACFWIAPNMNSGFDSVLKTKNQKAKRTESNSKVNPAFSVGGETLASYLARIKIPTYYTWRYFLPLMSSITTCTHDELLGFPASDIVGYARQTYRKPHYTVTGGVQQAEARLSSGLSVKFNTKVTNVESIKGGRVRVSWVTQGQEGAKEYDRVIIAVTPDVVGRIFSPLSKEMSFIPTTTVQTVVHRDWSRVEACSAYLRNSSRLQKRKYQAVSSAGSGSGSGSAPPLTAMHMVTDVNKSRTESIHEHPAQVLVTTYAMDGGIEESKILHRVEFTRVLRTSQSQAVVNSIFTSTTTTTTEPAPYADGDGATSENESWKNGDGNVFIVGGWCWDGMVLLEGCIISAMRVADALEVDIPWVR